MQISKRPGGREERGSHAVSRRRSARRRVGPTDARAGSRPPRRRDKTAGGPREAPSGPDHHQPPTPPPPPAAAAAAAAAVRRCHHPRLVRSNRSCWCGCLPTEPRRFPRAPHPLVPLRRTARTLDKCPWCFRNPKARGVVIGGVSPTTPPRVRREVTSTGLYPRPRAGSVAELGVALAALAPPLASSMPM